MPFTISVGNTPRLSSSHKRISFPLQQIVNCVRSTYSMNFCLENDWQNSMANKLAKNIITCLDSSRISRPPTRNVKEIQVSDSNPGQDVISHNKFSTIFSFTCEAQFARNGDCKIVIIKLLYAREHPSIILLYNVFLIYQACVYKNYVTLISTELF